MTEHAKRAQKGSGLKTASLVAIPVQVARMPTTTNTAWTVQLVNTPKNDRTVAKNAVLERSLRQNRHAALLVKLGITPTTSRTYAHPAA